jgi:transposase
VLTLVATIKTLGVQITELERQIASAIREHPDGQIFLSLFKGSVITAAELLAEIGDCRARYPSRDALAGDAGQAAVALESGKRKTASFRWGCNKRLRKAFCTLADSTRHWHPWAQALYPAAIARGHEHPRAIRTLGRAWCRVAWQGWQKRTPYDPPATAPCNSTSRSPSPPRRGPWSTKSPRFGWPPTPSLPTPALIARR